MLSVLYCDESTLIKMLKQVQHDIEKSYWGEWGTVQTVSSI